MSGLILRKSDASFFFNSNERQTLNETRQHIFFLFFYRNSEKLLIFKAIACVIPSDCKCISPSIYAFVVWSA